MTGIPSFDVRCLPDSLAYLTAKTNGFEDLADEILDAAGLTKADVDDVPSFGISTLKPPPIVTPTATLNWPTVSATESFWDRALANGSLDADGEIPHVNGFDTTGAAATSALDAWAKEEELQDEIDPETQLQSGVGPVRRSGNDVKRSVIVPKHHRGAHSGRIG